MQEIKVGEGDVQLTINQRHPRSISTTSTHARKITIQKFRAAYLQTFLYNFRGKLVHTVVNCPKKDMFNGAAPIVRGTMLADMLNAPIAKLSMS